MPDKCSDSVINQTHLDPEPIAIITLCVGTLAMVGAVANTFINYRKYLRDESDRELRVDVKHGWLVRKRFRPF